MVEINRVSDVLAKRPKANFIDRLVTIVSPQRGLARFRARSALYFGGGYTGARTDRTATQEWTPRVGDPDSDILGDLPALRARSRDLSRNTPLAAGAINTVATSVVGSGITLQSRVDADLLGLSDEQAADWQAHAERIWDAVAGTTSIDLARTLSFVGLQDLVLRSQKESGDIFVVKRFKKRPGDLLGLKLQLLEADRINTPTEKASNELVRDGVETDEDGAPVRYWVQHAHPGSVQNFGRGGSSNKWTSVPAFSDRTGDRLVLHLYRLKRPGQVRGVPYLAPVIESLKQLGRYTDSELMAAVISSMVTVFTKTEAAAGVSPMEGLTDTQKEEEAAAGQLKLGHGLIVDLLPGEDIETVNPTRPNEKFDPFVLAICRQIGVALEIPYELVVKHFTASYSAARAALLEAWRFFRTEREWLVREFCRPVYRWVIAESVARGLLQAPGFFDDPLIQAAWLSSTWTGPGAGQLDEFKEMQASMIRMRTGVSTLQEETARITGGDWETNHRQRTKEVRMRREAGLDVEPEADKTIQIQKTDEGDGDGEESDE